MDERSEGLKNAMDERVDRLETNINAAMDRFHRGVLIEGGAVICIGFAFIFLAIKLL